MVKDRQVRRLWKLLAVGKGLSRAAAEHAWRTRPDPFAEVWPEVHGQLEASPGLRGKTLFAWLQPASFRTDSCVRFNGA